MPPVSDSDVGHTVRRQRVFRVLKIAVPAATGLIIVLALFWPQLVGRDTRIDIAVPDAARERDEQPEAIVNATYSGIDREGRPFSIRARSVRNPEGDPAALQLIEPDAQIALKDGSVLTIVADQGLYQRDRDSLDLQGEVTLRRDGDLTVVTERANIDLRASSASGDRPVGATSPHGTLSGTGFRIAAGGDSVFVNGPAQMEIVPGAKTVLP
jgi:lipopolysaccharide export system protein LptC